jgi:outer membrane protein assembly factor BamA
VHVLELAPHVVYDTRDTAAIASQGFYFDAFAGHTLPVTPDASFFHYGAQLATFFDLWGQSRVLSLRVVTEAVHGRDADIPFSELIKIGGPERLRGYRLDRFRDRVGAVATAEYRYPIHQLVSGELFFDAGRVGRTHASVFGQLEDLRYGGGLGFVFHDADKVLFKLEVAQGEDLTFFFSTDPLEAFARRDQRL